MRQGFFFEHWYSTDGATTGGVTTGRGFTISWQNGPLGRGNARKEPNGAFVEDIIAAALNRLEYYQASKFECAENVVAIRHLQAALSALGLRTKNRESRNVEGTHEP